MPSIRRALVVLALVAAGCGGGDADEPGPATTTATPTAATATVAAPEAVTCDEAKYTPTPSKSWAHPSENFYEPGMTDAPTANDLEHLLVADNAIVVSYAVNQSAGALNELRQWSGEQTASVALPATAPDAPPIQAKIARAVLTCDGVDVAQLTAFAEKRPDSAPPDAHSDGG
jgi:hypothetical protein